MHTQCWLILNVFLSADDRHKKRCNYCLYVSYLWKISKCSWKRTLDADVVTFILKAAKSAHTRHSLMPMVALHCMVKRSEYYMHTDN